MPPEYSSTSPDKDVADAQIPAPGHCARCGTAAPVPAASEPDLPAHRLDLVITRVQERLNRLPSRADTIAEFLHQLNITGTPHSGLACPLGLYLGANLPPTYVVRVDKDQIQIVDAEPTGRVRYTIALVAHLTTFVRRFDALKYPFLLIDCECPGPGERA